jgi:hypothetical protein
VREFDIPQDEVDILQEQFQGVGRGATDFEIGGNYDGNDNAWMGNFGRGIVAKLSCFMDLSFSLVCNSCRWFFLK